LLGSKLHDWKEIKSIVLSGAERTGPPGGGPARDARHGGGPAAGGPWRTKTKTGAANPPDRGDEVPADK